MTEPLWQKVLRKIYPFVRAITGHEYDCCGTLKRCSKCKYVKESDGE